MCTSSGFHRRWEFRHTWFPERWSRYLRYTTSSTNLVVRVSRREERFGPATSFDPAAAADSECDTVLPQPSQALRLRGKRRSGFAFEWRLLLDRRFSM